MTLIRQVNDVLEKEGVETFTPSSATKQLEGSALTPTLNEAGASVDEAIRRIAGLMHHADEERLQLEAARDVLKLHNVVKPEAEADSRIIFVINGVDTMQMAQVINPKRASRDELQSS